jgi:hypothetical protein
VDFPYIKGMTRVRTAIHIRVFTETNAVVSGGSMTRSRDSSRSQSAMKCLCDHLADYKAVLALFYHPFSFGWMARHLRPLRSVLPNHF